MSSNFMARTFTCGKCEMKYMPAYQSPECPHTRLVDLQSSKLMEEIKRKVLGCWYKPLAEGETREGELIDDVANEVTDQILAYLKSRMKITIIGEEQSVPNGTKIYFLFKEELE